MGRFVSIGEAAKILGVSISTLRRWEKEGRLIPNRTKARHRRYDLTLLEGIKPARVQNDLGSQRKTVAYARVSSRDQKDDHERQKQVLEMYCASHGWQYEILSDLGSGMNYRKKGLQRLLSLLVSGDVERLVITHKDRLLRFGAELVFSICEMKSVEVVIINRGADNSFEEDLAKDVLEIITVFSARLYGSRSKKTQRLIEGLKSAVEASDSK